MEDFIEYSIGDLNRSWNKCGTEKNCVSYLLKPEMNRSIMEPLLEGVFYSIYYSRLAKAWQRDNIVIH
ncbi:hypothetical protein [Evansella clarkii]|uniref:hypothetical protein n=1 Tax=Evansella clarkii TaxID=79879 RepID=UPI000B43244B|nr:hypothetical protein [Evansella clarkii]